MALTTLRSEIAGTIWKIEVSQGGQVAQGDTLIVIESMKMEIPVVAEQGGKVVEILVAEQEPVSEGQELIRIET
ncbi:MAG: acetyl-CoA carboxylase biotin carboxyl carrier protein subunit [SAR324 cluster bacterium]|nr:acetyl-CoA carboxylase biotin carboxyl carrier protein subunit [SAR324 cluster bacterium]MCH8885161.1 acetyl-CoA carboxylase biotin carboxyl carrier protein subunit [SAR324 cluster bacterium]